MKMNELVSVIIPCYNSGRWINETLESVFNQTYLNIEVIIVDDGSTDNTKDIVLKYKKNIKYVYQDNKGPSAARNVGIKEANGKYIAFLDSDDLWDENKIAKQVNVLENDESISLVFSNVDVINEDGKYLYTYYKKVPKQKNKLIRDLYFGNIGMNTPTIIARRTVVNLIQGFDESLPRREDHYFLMMIAEKYGTFHIEEPLSKVRINTGSISRTTQIDKLFQLYKPFFKKSVKRFPYLKKYERHAFSKVNTTMGRKYWKLGNRDKGIKHLLKAIYYNPLRFINYVILILLCFNVRNDRINSIKSKLRLRK